MVNKEKYPSKITFYITSKQRRILDREIKKHDLSISDFLRLAIENAPYIFNPSEIYPSAKVLDNIINEIDGFKRRINKYINENKETDDEKENNNGIDSDK